MYNAAKISSNFFTEAGAFGNNLGKEPPKSRPKLKNMYILYLYLLRILTMPAI